MTRSDPKETERVGQEEDSGQAQSEQGEVGHHGDDFLSSEYTSVVVVV